MKYEFTAIRLAVMALGAVAVLCVLSIVVLSIVVLDVPDALAGIGGGAVGALATILTTYTPAPVTGGRRVSDPSPPDVPPAPSPPDVPPAG